MNRSACPAPPGCTEPAHRAPVIAVQPPLDFRPRGAEVTYEAGVRADQFRRAWAEFAAARPDVIEWVIREILAAQWAGAQTVQIKTVLGRARERWRVSINNNWPSYAADWIEERHPEFAGLFRRKGRPAEKRPAKEVIR